VTALTIASPDEMARFGAKLAVELRAGDLVLLNGELGAGKTTLTRGIGEALGVRGAVTSPTFVLARTHPRERRLSSPHGRIETSPTGTDLPPLVHVDAYRLSSAMELDDLDIDFAGSIVVVEWGAGLTDGITDDWLQIDIVRRRGGAVASVTDDDVDDPSDADAVEPREVNLTAHGDRWRGWVDAVGN